MDPASAIEEQAISKLSAINEAIKKGDSNIQKFYRNAVVFITGGSGFVGKLLLEKLLRACNVNKVYLLLRTKKTKNVQERLEEILEDPVFSSLKKLKPDFSSKIVCVEGDIAEIRLGLQDQDWQTLADEVEVIFHCAATTRFDERLRVATLVNVRGTREVLLLAAQANNLKSFVHVSTAYSHATVSKIGADVLEQFYQTPVHPETMIKLVESFDDDILHGITEKLTKDWPNTYTFVKAIAEEQVKILSSNLPITIVRPSIVISSYQEPIPGWLDMSCAYSASGLVVGLGLGIIHTLQMPLETEISLVPVDYVVNACLAAGYDVGTRQQCESETPIYNVVMSRANKLDGDIIQKSLFYVRNNFPSPKAVWKIFVLRTSCFYTFYLLNIILHLIPALFGDAVCFIIGKELRFIKLYKKVYKLLKTLGYFFTNTHKMGDTNLTGLFDSLSQDDRLIFNFDMKPLLWKDVLIIWCLGVRKYLIKDGLKDTEEAKVKQFKYLVLNLLVGVTYFSLFIFVSLCFWNVLFK